MFCHHLAMTTTCLIWQKSCKRLLCRFYGDFSMFAAKMFAVKICLYNLKLPALMPTKMC